jgi:hypothetical protein
VLPPSTRDSESEQTSRKNFSELFYVGNEDDQNAEQYTSGPRGSLCIPFQTQHTILGIAQNTLEHCCYDFALQWFPGELEIHGWDCAEAVELTAWTRFINERSNKLPKDAFAEGRSLSRPLVISVHLLRHTAVHRLRTSARELIRLIRNALTFAEVLRGSSRTLQLQQLYEEVENIVKNIEADEYGLHNGNTAVLQNELDGIVPQGNDHSLEEELAALFDMLPTCYMSNDESERDESSDEWNDEL